MTNYTKTTNFATKDTLPSGNANKIVKGTEIDTEFNNIATAVATKADTAGPTFTGTVTIPTVDLNGGAIDGTTVGASTAAAITGTTIVANTSINIAGDGATVTGIKDEDDMSSNSATKLATQQSIKAYVDSQVTAQDLDFQADTGGALSIDLDSETLTFTGGTGIDTSGALNAVTFAIDSTVATLTGSQTLSNKTLATPVVSGNLTTNGLIDGRDVATDGTKLDGIEASADVTDTANVTAAGALMDSELTDIAAVKALNQGVATTDSPTFAGIDVTGTVTADGLTVDGGTTLNTSSTVFANLNYSNSNLGKLSTDGINVNLEANSNLFLKANSATRAKFDGNGDISFYEDTGTTAKFFWDASAESLGIGTSSPATALDVTGTVTADSAKVENSTTSTVTISESTGSGTAELRFVATESFPKTKIVTDVSAGSLSLETLGNERLNIANNGDISFYNSAGTSQSLFWDASAERLGIGTASPTGGATTVVDVYGLSSSAINFHNATAGTTATEGGVVGQYGNDLVLFNYEAGIIQLGTSNTERMRIDSSGNLLVGKTGPGDYVTGFEVQPAGAVLAYRTNGVASIFGRTNSGEITRFTTNGQIIGQIGSIAGNYLSIGTGDTGLLFQDDNDFIEPCNVGTSAGRDAAIDLGHSGGRFKDLYLSGGAYIGGVYNTGIYNQQSGDIQFWVPNVGEAVRIQQNTGNLLVGKTSQVSAGRFGVQYDSGQHGVGIDQDFSGGGTFINFLVQNSPVGSVQTNGSTTSYNTSSDYRLKENIVDAPSASDDIDAIQVRSFDWKADGSHQKYGMVAQELQAVAPEAVSIPDDPEEMAGVDYSKLVPMLVKEIQSLRARVQQLENN